MMKNMVLLLVALTWAVVATAAEKKDVTIVYKADLHCGSCKAKVEKNIPYEKGVKKLDVNLEGKTITVTFRSDKNNAEGIKKAIEKLDVPVSSYAEQGKEATSPKAKEAKEQKKCSDACDGHHHHK